jgi:hypothetical protein
MVEGFVLWEKNDGWSGTAGENHYNSHDPLSFADKPPL